MTTPAQRKRERIEAQRAQASLAARAETAAPVEKAKATRTRASGSGALPAAGIAEAPTAATIERAVSLANRRSPATMRRLRIEAGKAAARPANDNAQDTAPAEGTGPEALIRLQLVEDKRRLKALESVEAKIRLKAELVGRYDAWIEAVLAAGAGTDGRAVQDDVVATLFMWKVDIGDYAVALAIADHLLRHKLALPPPNVRSVSTFLAEEIAEAAIKAANATTPFPLDLLADVHVLTDDRDMHDQVRAKLYKADGLVLLAMSRIEAVAGETEGADEHNVAGAPAAARKAAREALARALSLENRIGVKKELEQLDRLIAADDKEAADRAAAAATALGLPPAETKDQAPA